MASKFKLLAVAAGLLTKEVSTLAKAAFLSALA